MESALAALDPGHSAGERLLRAALNHFDRILTQHEFQSLMQQEMVRFRRGESETHRLAGEESSSNPCLKKLQEAVARRHRDRRAMRGGLAADRFIPCWAQMFSIFSARP